MKKHRLLWFATIVLTFVACKNTTQSTIEGTIKNLPEYIEEITLQTENKTKTIKIDEEGKFKDTINFDNSFALLRIGTFGKMLFLNKESQLQITADADDFNNTIAYSGKGAKENNYILDREKITSAIFVSIDSVMSLKEEAFDKYISTTKQKIESLLSEHNQIDSFLETKERENLASFIKTLKEQHQISNKTAAGLKPGSPSPEFNDLENYKGGTTSLKDLRGKYVYIDVWATWCMPCLQQIPFLKKLEEKFHNKDISFVSLSIDSPKDKSKWKQMIADKKLKGIQLFTNGNIPFLQDYQITGIPRFILLDKEGKIVDANALRPSQPQLEQYLDDLLK